MTVQLEVDPRSVRTSLRISQERMGHVMGVSSKTIERWEAAGEPSASPDILGRFRALREIADLGRIVYAERGFEIFLRTPLREFDGRTALQLLESGETGRVLGALARDYEGQWA